MLTIPVNWCTTEWTRGQLDFHTPDGLVAFAQQNGMVVRGHPLVYQECLPPWLADGQLSRAEMTEILRDHVMTIVRRYRGHVRAWDVVNEAVAWDTSQAVSWNGIPIKQNVFSRALGPEYVEMAFRWAHDADPEAKLFYNEYGIETPNEMTSRVLDLVRSLLAHGVPIHGVGFQTHTSIYTPNGEDAIRSALAQFADLGLEVQITEMDVDVNEVSGARALPLPPEPELSGRLARQATVYANVLRACLSLPTCTGVTTWGLSDAHTWLEWFQNPDKVQRAPLLFDSTYAPKPAYSALHDALAGWRGR
jgi:endo-1,4-beta-xylanase